MEAIAIRLEAITTSNKKLLGTDKEFDIRDLSVVGVIYSSFAAGINAAAGLAKPRGGKPRREDAPKTCRADTGGWGTITPWRAPSSSSSKGRVGEQDLLNFLVQCFKNQALSWGKEPNKREKEREKNKK